MSRFDLIYKTLSLYARLCRIEHGMGLKQKRKWVTHVRRLYGRWHSVFFQLLQQDAPLPGFSEKEAQSAVRQRDELLDALSRWAHNSANGSKLYTGSLSPGCKICQNGDWGCNLVNRRCTRDCYFCKRPHSMGTERPSETEGHTFMDPSEHIDFLKTFQIKGVGFSGGEPLLAAERLLSHIKAIRQEFGRSMYVWIYTNGDLVDRHILKHLQKNGADEIRFNLSARAYDLSPVRLARDYIPKVTIEIPAIPEDFEVVRDILGEMQKIGIDFLNLHQLYLQEENWRALTSRRYRLSCDPGITVFESELCALRLLLYACEHSFELPIHYCSHAYKLRFQNRGMKMRRARVLLEGFQEISGAGFIRSLWVTDSSEKINSMVHKMEDRHCEAAMWKFSEKRKELAIHSSLMPYVDWSSSKLNIEYLKPEISLKRRAKGFKAENLKADHRVVFSLKGLGRTSFECWRRIYLENENARDVLGSFPEEHLKLGRGKSLAQKEASRLSALSKYEELESGLAHLY